VTRPNILCVDDEVNVLDGLRRLLRKSYEVKTATGGAEALELLTKGETFAVVVSDMRMPGMNGAALLAELSKRAPDTVRLLLTGQTDVESAILAVNEGHVFRFLTKPCAPEALSAAIAAGVAQHQLVTAERVLLEQTLVGSIRAMTEVLALLHPELFGAASQRHERAHEVALALGVTDAWHVEVASMLASVGYVVLPSDIVIKLQAGVALDDAERGMTEQVPEVVERVLSHIPRLQQVREVLKHSKITQVGKPPAKTAAPIGSRILDALQDLAAAEAREGDTVRAVAALRASAQYPTELLDTLERVCRPEPPEIRSLSLDDVRTGMVLASDVKATTGILLVARGQPVTAQLLQRLLNFRSRRLLVEPLLCEVPRTAPASRAGRTPAPR
jgi:CheY-like chemotaxis protein